MTDSHAVAQELSSNASVLAASGDAAGARALYRQAAEHEERAFFAVPADRPRTRGIFAVSLVSLRYKARDYPLAERWCHRLLAEDGLQGPAHSQLRELLEVVTDERLLLERDGREYAGDALTVSMRGGLVGWGTAPLHATLEYGAAASAWIYRVAEFQGRYPFRVRGRPPAAVLEAVQARTSQPTPGSYRFAVRLTRPAQPDLFQVPSIDPVAVTDTVFRFVGLVNAGDGNGLRDLVPDEQHRKGLLRVLRSLVPEGRSVGEIEFIRPSGQSVEVAALVPATREQIRQHLASEIRVPDDTEHQSVEIAGVLRAVHLDQNWLELHTDEGTQRCATPKDMLDDVVGPMVNRRVAGRGHWRKKRSGRRSLYVEDIELAEESRT